MRPAIRTPTQPDAARQDPGGLLARLTRLEWASAAFVAVVLLILIVAEPDILEAPVENGRTMLFTFGGTAVGAGALVLMLRHCVHPLIRVLVLGVPLVAVTWWLVSPFFIDDVVDEDFSISIADAAQTEAPPVAEPDIGATTTAPGPPAAPVLLGAGQFVGLAGHEGTGDAGFFALDSGRLALRFENFDIENGPDLRLYVVPGRAKLAPNDGSLYLGELRGNVGDQTYDLPADFVLAPGDWTVLVWCEAFDVEFVAATISVA